MAKKEEPEKPIPPIPAEPRIWAYDQAVERAEKGKPIDKVIAFDHEEFGRSSGDIAEMIPLGRDNKHDLPDFDILVRGRTGKTARIKMLEHHGQIYHTYSEADEDVVRYRKAREIL